MHGLKAKATIRGVELNATPWRYGTIKLLEIRLSSNIPSGQHSFLCLEKIEADYGDHRQTEQTD